MPLPPPGQSNTKTLSTLICENPGTLSLYIKDGEVALFFKGKQVMLIFNSYLVFHPCISEHLASIAFFVTD